MGSPGDATRASSEPSKEPRSSTTLTVVTACAIIGLALGFRLAVLDPTSATSASDEEVGEFLLVLREVPGDGSEGSRIRSREARQLAARLAGAGMLVSAGALSRENCWPVDPGVERAGAHCHVFEDPVNYFHGYYVIQAPSVEAALRFLRSNQRLLRRASIELRAIEENYSSPTRYGFGNPHGGD